MTDKNRDPQQQKNDPQRQAPGQQQQQAHPKPDEKGRNPGGQDNQQNDNAKRGDR